MVFKKGHIPYMKGKQHKPESNEKNRLAHLGKPSWNKGLHGVQAGENHPLWGKKHKPESIEKMRKSHRGTYNLGKIPWNKDLKGWCSGEKHPMYGKHHTKESNMKNRMKHLGKPSPNKGKPVSEEQKLKQSKTMMGRQSPRKGMKNSKEHIEKYKQWRKTQVIPRKDTKPERMMQIALLLEGIKYRKHEPIIGQPDIFIDPNICIFVDGDYWHSLPKTIKRDQYVNYELTKQGYHIIRIKESDIKNDVGKTAKNIIKLIKECSDKSLEVMR